jgi:cation transport protein ChaC
MWDGWEAKFECIRRETAVLEDYSRSFNKKSTLNWGTKSFPGPTLNLLNTPDKICQGIAFEFPDAQKDKVFAFLDGREGKGFQRDEVIVHIEDKSKVSAFVYVYIGPNIIDGGSIEDVANMVVAASGTEGTCLQYVNGVAKELSRLGIEDSAVSELLRAIDGKHNHH